MVVTDRHYQVAMRLGQVHAQDRGGGGDVETRIIDQPFRDGRLRHVRIARQRIEPDRVDLHHAKIGGAVGVDLHISRPAAFHHLNCRQDPRRQMIEGRGGGHAS